MKKKTKQRIFAALATVALALPVGLGLGSKAQAADESSNPTQTIEIHKLIFDKIPEKQTNNGSDNPFQDGKPLNGAGFTAYDVTDKYWDLYKTNKGNSEQAVKDLLDKIKEPNKSDQAKDASGKNIPEVKTATKDGAEGVADLVLPTTKAGQNAVYIIFETTTPNGANNQKAIPFVVGLPVYTDTENLLSPIKVYPKNEYRTSTLEFTKYGVYLNKITKLSSSKPLSGAMFYLEDTDNKKIYSTETNDFTLDETDKAMDKAKLSSDDSGKVSVPNLVLKDGGHYAFYEMDSSVSTSSLQEQTEKEEIFHYSNNPVVIVDANRETNTEKNSQAKMILTYHFKGQAMSVQKDTDQIENDQTVTATPMYNEQGDVTYVYTGSNETGANAYNYIVPEPTKNADDHDLEIGQKVTFTIKLNIPNDVAQYTKFELEDEYDSKLELISSMDDINATVNINGNAQKNVETTTVKNSETKFTVKFNNPKQLTPYINKDVTFTVDMRLKPGTALDTGIANKINFNNNFKPKHNQDTVKTYGHSFIKKDLDSGKPLQGAEFVIARKTVNDEKEFAQFANIGNGSHNTLASSKITWIKEEKMLQKYLQMKMVILVCLV